MDTKLKNKKLIWDIQSIIMVILMLLSTFSTLAMGVISYNRYAKSIKDYAISNANNSVESTILSLDNSLLTIRQLSNTINYYLLQENEVNSKKFAKNIDLLYEANKECVQSISIFDDAGNLLYADPINTLKPGVDVTKQNWFMETSNEIENIHFSNPHLQNIFNNTTKKMDWVISVSRSVDILGDKDNKHGILLIDIRCSYIWDILNQLNAQPNNQYFYLCDGKGNFIYHPRMAELNRGIIEENNNEIVRYEDGVHINNFQGKNRRIAIGTLSYTGWRLVGVIPNDTKILINMNFRKSFLISIIFLLMMLLLVNRIISRQVSKPIQRLNDSVKKYETSKQQDIYIGGSSEIRSLGLSIQKSYEKNQNLMEEVIRQQNERRKSEIGALQTQIYPHFLYNTLESITWMIEGGRNKEAVFMVTELAKLLRISLSKGKTIISLKDEIQHSKSYMNIQKMRYKNHFSVDFDIDEEIYNYSTVKLIIQPILENAIYYGVGNMDEDDEGNITVRAYKKETDIYIEVEDNGMGMDEYTCMNVLKDTNKVPKHGSGVGLINVHRRIQLIFGLKYGLRIESEPDEGTIVTIHIPAVEYNEKSKEELEKSSVSLELDKEYTYED